jgi:long-subunit fatty acid transport protein
MNTLTRSSLTAVALLMLAPAIAHADSPSQQFTQGGQGSGVASETSVGSLFFNPAIATGLPNNQLHADLTLSWRTGTYTRMIDGAEQDPARLLSFDYQPNFAFSRQLADSGLFVGLAIGRGYLDRTHWLDAEQGEQRWQSIYSGLRTWKISPSAAFAFNDRFSLGASVQLTRVHAYGYQALDYGPLFTQRLPKDDIPSQAPGNEGRAYMDFKGNAGAFSLGATIKASDRTTIGASFVSSSQVQIDGDVSVYRPRNRFYEIEYEDQEEASATLKMTLPGKVQLGVMHALSEHMDVQADLELTQWAALDEVIVDITGDKLGDIENPDRTFDTSFRNTAALRLGLTRHTAPNTSTFMGLGYQSSPVADEHLSPAWLYGHTIEATYGMKFPIGPRRTMGIAYTQQVMLPRDVETSEQVPGTAGKYSQYAGFLNVSFDWEITNRTLNLPEVQSAPTGATNL